MSSAKPFLAVPIARAVDEARERLEDGLSEAAAWVERAQSGAVESDRCAICERTDGPFEEHHVAGRLNSELTICACLRCHGRLSERQNGWDPHWQVEGNPPAVKDSLLLRGLGDLCEERARHFGPTYHELAKRLRATYAKRAREAVA